MAGIDAAGRVEAVGSDVQGIRPGDDVLDLFPGAFAEHACGKADVVVPVPTGLTFEQAAATPIAAVTALCGIQDVGRVQAGHHVFINGAGGGIGTFAVPIASAIGADVTGVCSTQKAELVGSLGATHIIDYTQQDFTAAGLRYDVILDNVGDQPLRRLRHVLTPAGTLVANGGGSPGKVFGAAGALLRLMVINMMVRLVPILPDTPAGKTRENLLSVVDLSKPERSPRSSAGPCLWSTWPTGCATSNAGTRSARR